MNKKSALLCVFGALLAFAAAPARAADAPSAINSFTLVNGMEVVVIENHRAPAVSHMMWIKVGAADDPLGKSGLAHYHEHMMFQGADASRPGDYADIIAANGGQNNAFTSADATSYYVNISKDKLPLVMQIEAERLRSLKANDALATKEKQVIIEERRARIENDPEALLSEQMRASLFRHHPYRIPVIGWMHEMEKLTRSDVAEFHGRYYHPNNAVLVVSGDITAAELKPLAQRYYGVLPRGRVPARNWVEEPPQLAPRRMTLSHPNVKQPSWHRDYMTASLVYGKTERALPLFVLAQLLGGGKTSTLYQTLVTQKKLASSADVSYSGFSVGPAVLSIDLVPERGIEMDSLEQALDEALATFAKDGIKDEDFARAKTLLKSESLYARDGLMPMAQIMGQLRVLGLDKDYFGRWPSMIEAVTKEQVMEAAKETLQLKQSVTGQLLPQPQPPKESGS